MTVGMEKLVSEGTALRVRDADDCDSAVCEIVVARGNEYMYWEAGPTEAVSANGRSNMGTDD